MEQSSELTQNSQIRPWETLDLAPSALDTVDEDFSPAERRAAAHVISRPSLSYWQDAWIRLRKNRQSVASLGVVVFLAVFTLAGPYLWRLDPADQDLSRISEPPTLSKTAVVLAELPAYQETVLADFPAAPKPGEASASPIPAPESLDFIGDPSTRAVRLKWPPVKGASGYSIYRAEGENIAPGNLGVPIAQIDGANHVSYEDSFNLEAKTYFYSVVPTLNGTESESFVSRKATLQASLSLEDAQKIRPDAKLGDTVKLAAHPLGTDYLGRDMLARLIAGARVSLFIGFFAPLLWILMGVLIGGISGYAGGKTDHWLMRITDFVLALPFLLFMILFKVAFGAQPGESGIMPMLVAMVLLSWTSPARLVRGQVLQLRESEFVQASRLLGAKPWYLVLRHLLPNTLGVVLVTFTFGIPTAIFTEAFLSFIGMGVVPPTPSWGGMCNEGIQRFLTTPHEFFFPAVLISITVLAFNLLGDGLRDALDPRLRSRE